jgi:hypothetical protein
MKISAKDLTAAKKFSEKTSKEKATVRDRVTTSKWTAPAGPGPGSDKEVDKELRRIMKPTPSHG